eukprot:TRINITY_DN2568_c0_g2_i5.p1 TRINITY_DN2568_c0_g2~~TRINITY_DN2568_c0_g2_i5.p1  ORF type:complete len:330 (+),score=-83.26 TRINITY_DN2568_c0_g2_i5:104-1093(+)
MPSKLSRLQGTIRDHTINWLDNLSCLSLSPASAVQGLTFTDEDLDGLFGKSSDKILGVYSEQDIWDAMHKFGVIDHVAKQGFKQLSVTSDTSDPFVHEVVLTDQILANNGPETRFLIKVFIRRRDFVPINFKAHGRFPAEVQDFMDVMLKGVTLHLTVIEYMIMQNPTKTFESDRRQLPSQRHPGLGCGRKMDLALKHMAEEHGRDGMLNFPENWHNAYFYQAGEGYQFINPAFQGHFNSLCENLKEDLKHKGLAAVAWAVNTQQVIDTDTGQPYVWKPEEQIWPTSCGPLKAYFSSKHYSQLVNKYTEHRQRFVIQWTEELLIHATVD